MARTTVVPDVTAMRALSHPVRLRMLALLRFDGPATATRLAQRLDLNTGATSYHLRQLELHGFVVEDTGRGTRRERWWRSAHDGTAMVAGDSDAERDASDAFLQAAVITQTQLLQAAVDERPELPDAWRRATSNSDWFLHLDAATAEEMLARLHAVIQEYADRYPPPAELDDHDDQVSDGAADAARQFLVQLHAFPRPGQLATGHRPQDASP